MLENTKEGINNGWQPTSDMPMVKPTKCANRPKSKPSSNLKRRKTHKHPRVKVEAHTEAEVDLEESYHEGGVGANFEGVEDIPPPYLDPLVEPFMLTLF